MQVANGKTVLVVENDQELLTYLETALICDGYGVIKAHDGIEALSLLEKHSDVVSAVVLDIVLPRKDGIETLRELRQRDPDIPVIVVSGVSQPTQIVEAMRAGASNYLVEPLVHDQLLEAVGRATGNGKARVQTRKAQR